MKTSDHRMTDYFTAIGMVVILLIIIVIMGIRFNHLQSLDTAVTTAFSEVSNQYQRRTDLIPNLVNTIKAYTQHETQYLTDIVRARDRIQGLQGNKLNLNEPTAIHHFQNAQNELSQSLGQLLASTNDYPILQSSELFKDLMAQLEGTENRLAVARRRYNEAVEHYNTRIKQVPDIIIATLLNYSPKAHFTPDHTNYFSPTLHFK